MTLIRSYAKITLLLGICESMCFSQTAAIAETCANPSVSLELSVTDGQTAYKGDNPSIGEPGDTFIEAKLQITNLSDHPIDYSWDAGLAGPEPETQVWVTSVNHDHLHITSFTELLRKHELPKFYARNSFGDGELSPGQSQIHTFDVDDYYRLSDPGRYSMMVEQPDPVDKSCTIRSNLATFRTSK